jgi:hypothetical protein
MQTGLDLSNHLRVLFNGGPVFGRNGFRCSSIAETGTHFNMASGKLQLETTSFKPDRDFGASFRIEEYTFASAQLTDKVDSPLIRTLARR